MLSEIRTDPDDRVSCYFWIVEGGIVLLFNTALAAVILFTRKFFQQKEYVLLALNLHFDSLFGLQYFLSGIYLLDLNLKNTYIPLITNWNCYTIVWIQLMVIITPATGLLTLANSIDRLILLIFPLRYYKLGRLYPLAIVIIVFLCTLPTTIIAFFEAYSSSNKLMLATCFFKSVLPAYLYSALRGIRITSTLIAVLLYIPVTIKVRTILRKSGSIGTTQKRELKLTLTITLITLNQVVLFTVPDILLLMDISSFTFFHMNLNKGVINLLIILFCQSDIRQYVCRCSKKGDSLIEKSRSTVNGPKMGAKVGATLSVT